LFYRHCYSGFVWGVLVMHRSLSPEFESRREHIWRLFHLWLRFITFGGPDGTVPPLRIRKVPATYPPELWDVNTQTTYGDSRTNNLCESWNRGFSNHILPFGERWNTSGWTMPMLRLRLSLNLVDNPLRSVWRRQHNSCKITKLIFAPPVIKRSRPWSSS